MSILKIRKFLLFMNKFQRVQLGKKTLFKWWSIIIKTWVMKILITSWREWWPEELHQISKFYIGYLPNHNKVKCQSNKSQRCWTLKQELTIVLVVVKVCLKLNLKIYNQLTIHNRVWMLVFQKQFLTKRKLKLQSKKNKIHHWTQVAVANHKV